MNFILKIFKSIFRTFLTGNNTPSNQRLNNTIITITVCICLLCLCVIVCIILYKHPDKLNDIILYFGGLLTTFLTIAYTGKLIQKNIESKQDNP